MNINTVCNELQGLVSYVDEALKDEGRDMTRVARVTATLAAQLRADVLQEIAEGTFGS